MASERKSLKRSKMVSSGQSHQAMRRRRSATESGKRWRRARGNATDDRIGRHIPADDGARGNHRTVAYRYARQQDGGMPDPAIIADDHPVAAALGKEVSV